MAKQNTIVACDQCGSIKIIKDVHIELYKARAKVLKNRITCNTCIMQDLAENK